MFEQQKLHHIELEKNQTRLDEAIAKFNDAQLKANSLGTSSQPTFGTKENTEHSKKLAKANKMLNTARAKMKSVMQQRDDTPMKLILVLPEEEATCQTK